MPTAPQGVTELRAPDIPPPPGCIPNYPGTFGMLVTDVNTAGPRGRLKRDGELVSQIDDGQPQTPSGGGGAVSQIPDGQPQAPGGGVVSQIADGQIQAPGEKLVGQIDDGQIQAPGGGLAGQIGDGQIQAPGGGIASQIADGQIQAPGEKLVGQIDDGQIQAPGGGLAGQIGDGQIQAPGGGAVSQIGDGQVQAAGGGLVGQIGDGQIQAPRSPNLLSRRQLTPRPQFRAGASADSLKMTLENGVLKDEFGRTGYIASNYQFQFDDPPQDGSIFTGGFSVCNDGTLALGGSTEFYRCISGDFSNLYDRWWADQCSPVAFNMVELV
ncbi:hypothetical protein P152DRAFT_460428 [Eremomyces bilateralis CBS 781.70]|uniref:Cell wall mannoprotein PIR1-like C-terminal domain-containing protein n=1 Tax=Eremomyces bilateralis CBS 781.70 TaxID=1392243 RepID=A0A6G1FX23_9PEZI|nr:uncharacterized protein P152DRAFT_460428 [Eremomyces bilateralis CBS 781.70]KAF1810324.1 hypothetical protein P152DRAFT_460428 [Eremomyces bilateralis CBS 781.70]